jgi:hypothetical protein
MIVCGRCRVAPAAVAMPLSCLGGTREPRSCSMEDPGLLLLQWQCPFLARKLSMCVDDAGLPLLHGYPAPTTGLALEVLQDCASAQSLRTLVMMTRRQSVATQPVPRNLYLAVRELVVASVPLCRGIYSMPFVRVQARALLFPSRCTALCTDGLVACSKVCLCDWGACMCDWLQETCLGFIFGLCWHMACAQCSRVGGLFFQISWGFVELHFSCHWLRCTVPRPTP